MFCFCCLFFFVFFFVVVFIFFPEDKISDVIQIVSFRILILFLGRKKIEKHFRMSSAEIYIHHAKRLLIGVMPSICLRYKTVQSECTKRQSNAISLQLQHSVRCLYPIMYRSKKIHNNVKKQSIHEIVF